MPVGQNDAFVVKLNPTGTALLYATYLGGTGETHSNNFPTTAGAFQRAYGGSARDGFVAELSTDGTSLAPVTASWG